MFKKMKKDIQALFLRTRNRGGLNGEGGLEIDFRRCIAKTYYKELLSKPTRKTIKLKKDECKKFEKIMNMLKVNKWKKKYIDYNVCDGLIQNMVIITKDRKYQFEFANSFPDTWYLLNDCIFRLVYKNEKYDREPIREVLVKIKEGKIPKFSIFRKKIISRSDLGLFLILGKLGSKKCIVSNNKLICYKILDKDIHLSRSDRFRYAFEVRDIMSESKGVILSVFFNNNLDFSIVENKIKEDDFII